MSVNANQPFKTWCVHVGAEHCVDIRQFKILVEKCEVGVLDALEMDVGIVLLQRK